MEKQHGARPADTDLHDVSPLELEDLGVHLTLGATGSTSDSGSEESRWTHPAPKHPPHPRLLRNEP
jgi:hypothetical protein